jgi:hypothetical protein
MSTIVRPEYGPTLPEVTGSRWPRVRLALVVLGVIVAVWAALKLLDDPSSGRTVVVVKEPVAVNVLRDDRLEQVAPRGREELRLQTTAEVSKGTQGVQSFTISPLVLGAYVGDDPGAMLTVRATQSIAQLRGEIRCFALRGEGRTRVNLYPGYVITYEGRVSGPCGGPREAGNLFYGKRFFLYPDVPKPTEAVQVDLHAPYVPIYVGFPEAVGANGPLKLPLRSFNFGTERP